MRLAPLALIVSATPAHAQASNIATTPAKACPTASPTLVIDPVARRIEAALPPALTSTATRPATLTKRMHALRVPGIGVALIRRGRIAWAHGWGVRDAGICAPVTPDTLFQAALISKPVAALTTLRLVEQGRLNLDGDVDVWLQRWRLPGDPRFPPGRVTLRQLLNHTAGLSMHGFMGYPAGTSRPNLDGTPAANSPPVRLEATPGAKFSCSGGGIRPCRFAPHGDGRPRAGRGRVGIGLLALG